jgi:hypothetical protein
MSPNSRQESVIHCCICPCLSFSERNDFEICNILWLSLMTGMYTDHVLTFLHIFISYEQDIKDLGFDTVELNADYMGLNEENLLRLIRMVRNSGT